MDFWSSEHSEEAVYKVYTLCGLSWSAVSLETGAASYKWLVQVSQIFSGFFSASFGAVMSVFK